MASTKIFLGDSTQLNILEIPKILENIFQFLDLTTLKVTRCVSMNWSLESSRIMQLSTVIKIHEEEVSRNRSFREMLLQTKETCLLPFRYLDVDITKWTDSTLEEILSDPRLLPNHIKFRRTPHNDNMDFNYKLHNLFTNKNQLRSLLINFSPRINFSIVKSHPELESQPFRLYSLEELNLTSEVTGCYDSMDFILKLLESAPRLRKLYIMDLDSHFLTQILDRGNLRSVEEFECVFLRPKNFDKISTRNLPNLKVLDALVGFFNQLDTEFYTSNLPLQLVTGISSTIQELQISWNLNSYENIFPFCPELRSLKIRQWGGSLGAFNSRCCPQLKELNFSEDIIGSDDITLIEPNPSVTSFVLMCGEQNPEGLHASERFNDVLEHISAQFPSLHTLELAWAIRYETICLIVKTFGRLECLTLDTRCGFTEDIFTGFTSEELAGILEEGKELSELETQRKICLIDMTNLRKLILTCRIYDKRKLLTDNCLEFGIQKMANLKELRLDWNADLSATVAARSLKHLDKIEVLNMHEFRRCQTLPELKQELPQVEWREILYSNYDYDEDENWEPEDYDIDIDSEDEEEFDPDDLDLDEFLEADFYEHDNDIMDEQ